MCGKQYVPFCFSIVSLVSVSVLAHIICATSKHLFIFGSKFHSNYRKKTDMLEYRVVHEPERHCI